MSNGVIFPFLIVIIFSKEWVLSDNRVCEVWGKTVKNVTICTSNETIIENKDKNCQKYAEIAQTNNCTDYSKIRYHCLLNAYGNQTIEVCAPEEKIDGFCAEFNEEAGEIRPNYYLDCTLFKPPCKSHYNSPEAYLYKKCYNHTYNKLVIKSVKYGDVTTKMRPIIDPSGLPPPSSLQSSTELKEPNKTIQIVCFIMLGVVSVILIAVLPNFSRHWKWFMKARKKCKKTPQETGTRFELRPINNPRKNQSELTTHSTMSKPG